MVGLFAHPCELSEPCSGGAGRHHPRCMIASRIEVMQTGVLASSSIRRAAGASLANGLALRFVLKWRI